MIEFLSFIGKEKPVFVQTIAISSQTIGISNQAKENLSKTIEN